MKNKKLVTKVLVVVVILLLFFGSAPFFLKKSLIHIVKDTCSDCSLNVSTAGFNPLTGEFTLEDVSFTYTEKDSLDVQVEALSVEGELSYIDLLRGRTHIYALVIEKPKVVLSDIEGPVSREKIESKKEAVPNFIIPEVVVNDGSFSYINKNAKGEARLNTSAISGRMEGLGNTEEFVDNLVFCRLTGRIENSGEVILSVRSKVFQRPLKLSVDVQIKEQELSDVNTFFSEYAGLKLTGQLIEGRSQLRFDDKKVKTAVFAKFKNFDVNFSNTSDRSSLATFFMNLAKAVMYEGQNVGKDERKQIKIVELEQDKDESLVGFLLRSMKEAALKVARK